MADATDGPGPHPGSFISTPALTRAHRLAFLEMYPHFHRIAAACREQIQSRLRNGMNTSTTKAIDNAIVGWVLAHSPRAAGHAN